MSMASLESLAVRIRTANLGDRPLYFPNNNTNTLYRLCNTTDAPHIACQAPGNNDGCPMLESCRASSCSGLDDKPETAAVCAMTKCAESFTRCWGSYCVSWADPSLVKANASIDLSTLPQSLPISLQTEVERYNNISRDVWQWNNTRPSTSGITAGLCALGPTSDSSCSADEVLQITLPKPSPAAKSATFSPLTCNSGKLQSKALPADPCNDQHPCLFGSCFLRRCDPPDRHIRRLVFGVEIAAPVIVFLLLSRTHARRLRRIRETFARARTRAARTADEEVDRRIREQQAEESDEDERVRPPQYKDVPVNGETRLEYQPSVRATDNIEMQPLPPSYAANNSADRLALTEGRNRPPPSPVADAASLH